MPQNPISHTSSWIWERGPFLCLSRKCCRNLHWIHCHHHIHGLAVFWPMSPCHMVATFLQTQKVGSQDESVDVDCWGYFHEEISAYIWKKNHSYSHSSKVYHYYITGNKYLYHSPALLSNLPPKRQTRSLFENWLPIYVSVPTNMKKFTFTCVNSHT